MDRSSLRIPLLLTFMAFVLATAGCSAATGLNPFKKKEVKLPGERISVMKPQDTPSIDPAVQRKSVSVPGPNANADWPQPGGAADNSPGHLQLAGGATSVWSADVGEGSSDDGRLTASPIVYQGKVYTLDTRGTVTAFSASGGGRVWRVSLVPENEKGREGFGGGIAADDGRLYVATGFGTAVALNPAGGEVLWTRKVGAPVRSSPTAAGGKLFFVNTESRVFCLSGETGDEVWTFRGVPESATLLSNVSPAVSGNIVVVPYPSGEVVAFGVDSGKPAWVDSLARRGGGSSLAGLSDPARPVIDKGVVYAVGHSGRMVATQADNGSRVWTKNIHGTQMPWVAGESVFVVDVNGKLMALERAGGEIQWVTDLPGGGTWSGPVLAGGKLWTVSGKGQLVGVDAATGTVATQRDLGTAIHIAPVVAGGRMYILTDKAKLLALN